MPTAWAAPPTDVDNAIHREIQRVEREIQSRWRQVLDHAARTEERPGAPPGPPGLARQVEDLHRELSSLEGAVLGQEREAEWLDKLRSLRRVLGNLDRVLEGHRPPSRGNALATQTARAITPGTPAALIGGAVATDSCAEAPIVGNGTFTGTTTGATNDGSASCGSSSFSPDVWFRYVSSLGGRVSVDTFGSGFDTVLSIHTGCPTPQSTFQVACNDDAFGLQSAVSVSIDAGESLWVRVSGFNNANGPFELHVGPGGLVEGAVTGEGTGEPVTAGRIEAIDSRGFFETSAPLDRDGSYVLGLRAGSYRLVTDTSAEYLDEVYDDNPCLSRSSVLCNLAAGDAVGVNSLEAVSGIDFALGPGAAISGTVTDGSTGEPLEGVRIEVRFDGLIASAFTDPQGRYRVGGLVDADYLVTAEGSEYLDELFDDVPCEGGLPFGCSESEGTPVAIASGQDRTGIDFGLERRGTISGEVLGNGDPLPGVRMELRSSGGFFFRSTVTDLQGRYTFTGLLPRSYFVFAEVDGFIDEVYDGLACEDGCNVTLGTPLDLEAGEDLTAIDFDLQRSGGISGLVTEASSGARISNARVEVWDAQGQFVTSRQTSLAGRYSFDDLTSGDYFVAVESTFSSRNLLSQLYQGIDCPGGVPNGCEPTTGTPVTVTVGATTDGIDFPMKTLGTIAGRVTRSDSGQAVSFADVELWSEEGRLDRDFGSSSGQYTFSGLLPGTYFVKTDLFSSFVNEVYDDILCNPDCDPTKGTPIVVGLGTVHPDIDFEVERLEAGLVGTVLDEATGNPLVGTPIRVWSATGDLVRQLSTRPDGLWLADLPPGTYFVSTDADRIVNQVYPGVECDGACDPLTGTPLLVEDFDSIVRGIDFRLDGLPIFSSGFESGDFSAWSGALSALP